MGTLTYSKGTYSNGDLTSATEITNDFAAIKTYIDGKNTSVANLADDSANYCIAFTVASLTDAATEHFVTQVPSGCTLEPKLATFYFKTSTASGAGKLEIWTSTTTNDNTTRVLTATGGLAGSTANTIESTTSFHDASIPAGTPLMFKVSETGDDAADSISEISVALWCRSELTSA